MLRYFYLRTMHQKLDQALVLYTCSGTCLYFILHQILNHLDMIRVLGFTVYIIVMKAGPLNMFRYLPVHHSTKAYNYLNCLFRFSNTFDSFTVCFMEHYCARTAVLILHCCSILISIHFHLKTVN
jgi:hypothetical protein